MHRSTKRLRLVLSLAANPLVLLCLVLAGIFVGLLTSPSQQPPATIHPAARPDPTVLLVR